MISVVLSSLKGLPFRILDTHVEALVVRPDLFQRQRILEQCFSIAEAEVIFDCVDEVELQSQQTVEENNKLLLSVSY
jgi:hypothetical protein